METQQSIAIESFSYSWLSGNKPSLDGLDELRRTSIDVHYDGQSFDFDSIAQTTGVSIHADELFTNGFIRPAYIDPSKREPCNDALDLPPDSPFSSTTQAQKERIHCSFLRRFGKSTRRMLRNLYGNLRGCLRKSNRVDDVDRRRRKVKRSSPPQASSQRSTTTTSSAGDASSHIENSIYEAVLHCKRSIEQ